MSVAIQQNTVDEEQAVGGPHHLYHAGPEFSHLINQACSVITFLHVGVGGFCSCSFNELLFLLTFGNLIWKNDSVTCEDPFILYV